MGLSFNSWCPGVQKGLWLQQGDMQLKRDCQYLPTQTGHGQEAVVSTSQHLFVPWKLSVVTAFTVFSLGPCPSLLSRCSIWDLMVSHWRNCEICKRTKITRAPCRRRNGEAVPRAVNFGDLITADHKVLSDNCESRNNHRYAVVAGSSHSMDPGVSVQKQNFTRNPEKQKFL